MDRVTTGRLAAALTGAALMSGCSVGMALAGRPNKNPTVLYLGYGRQAVIERLGEPDASTVNEAGLRVDTYLITKGNAPNVGRAVFYGVLDVVTLFYWELVATPIEMQVGKSETSTYVVTYDQEGRVVDVQVTEGVNRKEALTSG